MSESRDDAQTKTRGTLLVVDGHSLAFRAFFALPAENFSTQAGQATNAVWGFATMLSQVLDSEKPDHLAVAFDMKGGTFRNEMLPQYKGTREAAPEDLLTQLPLIQKMLTALGVTYVEKQGYEGDDIIATLAAMGERSGYDTLVLSGDRDAFQLIDERVTVLYPGHHFKDLKHMTPQAVEDKYHVSPAQYPDLAALRGETADNIPGVPGVGDGFAAKWINQYGGLEGIIEHADEIGGKKGESLRENIEQVKLNRKVNALRRDVDLGIGIEDLTFGEVDADTLSELFTSLEFGPRTRSKVLKSFNAGKQAGDAADKHADDEDASDDLRIPEAVTIADEVTEEICEICGRNMVIKYGPHGKFLACPGFPECKNTKPYLEKIGVPCPKCGKDVVIKKTKKGRIYYGCEANPECDFMSWQRPSTEKCPKCGAYMVEKGNKLLCSNEQCGYSTSKNTK